MAFVRRKARTSEAFKLSSAACEVEQWGTPAGGAARGQDGKIRCDRCPIPWAEYEGIAFIDAWDAYEWCEERGVVSGRFWEGDIGHTSWGAYKNVKVTSRVVLDVEE